VSLLVNGNLTKEFRSTIRLRQGDPLAPFLFLIVAEGLAGLVREASRVEILEWVIVGKKEVEVKLLQFADDTILFCQPKYKYLVAIKTVLHSFKIVSRLKVNFHKSQVGAVGVSDMDLNIFSNCLNCSKNDLLFMYLEIRIRENPRKIEFWIPIIHKIQSRLCIWKGKLLSMARRLCLIKYVISASLLFYFPFFKAPKQVCKAIRSIQLNFLWGWGSEEENPLGCLG